MPRLKSRSFLRRSIAIGFLFGFLLQPGHESATVYRSAAGSVPFYIKSGDRVERHFRAYNKLLAGYYEALLLAAQNNAPDLLARFQAPEPLADGYQILPRITPDPVPAKTIVARAAYSWPWTERMIDGERRRIIFSMAELRRAGTMKSTQSRAILDKLVLEYRSIRERYSNIDAHVRYNRFWQAAIAADRLAYDRETLLQDQVLEYQSVVAALKKIAAAIGRSSFPLKTSGEPQSGIGANLSERAALLTERIGSAFQRADIPSFITVEHCGDEWIIRVPMFTDIEERDFIAAVKRIIESTWRIADGDKQLRVELGISYVSPASLYEELAKPQRGVPLDLNRHLERFPSGGAILTTGALTTHVQKHAIVLGPRTITPQVLAHEFGHILGFQDGYIRGYRNLRKSGFQIREVVVFPEDIMAAPGSGRVVPAQFKKIIGAAKTERCASDSARLFDTAQQDF